MKVANFHKHTINGVKELVAAAGLHELSELNRSLICRRQENGSVKTLENIYPYIEEGTLLHKPWPMNYRRFEP